MSLNPFLPLLTLSKSASMVPQTSLTSGMTDFLVTKCRESFLSHVSVLMSPPQKHEFQLASATGDFLFDQDLLEKTSGQVKEDTIISSNVSLARSGFKDKRSSLDASSSGRAESSCSGSSFGSALVRRVVVLLRSASVVAGAGILLRLRRVFRSRSRVPVRFP